MAASFARPDLALRSVLESTCERLIRSSPASLTIVAERAVYRRAWTKGKRTRMSLGSPLSCIGGPVYVEKLHRLTVVGEAFVVSVAAHQASGNRFSCPMCIRDREKECSHTDCKFHGCEK